jgi:predicted Ser/Thr protein kinase
MDSTLPTSQTQACLRADELTAFALGKLSADAYDRAAEHVESCERCLAALETATEHADSLLADLHRAATLGPLCDEPATAPPAYIGSYEIVRELGQGGMGVVYLARQPGADRLVALKRVHPATVAGLTPAERAGVLDRFRTEARAASRLTHENLVPVFEVGEADGWPFYTMRYIVGASLAAIVRDTGPLAPRQAAAHVEAVARAVQYAHTQGVVHRDLKPHNILIDADNRPYVTDFGLAKRLDRTDGPTISGRALGTLGYAAPEQVADASRAGVGSDVYGLGATLYALLTGRPPFQSASDADVLDHVRWHDAVPPRELNPAVPVDLETICLKCLRKEPLARYPSAGELADDLGRFRAGEPVRARRMGPGGKLWRWCRRRPALASALTAAVVGLVATSVISVAFAVEQARVAQERLENAEREAKLNQKVTRLAGVARDSTRHAYELLLREAVRSLPKLKDPQLNERKAKLLELMGDQPRPAMLESMNRLLTQMAELSPEDPEVAHLRQLFAYYCSVVGQQAFDQRDHRTAAPVLALAVSACEQFRESAPENATAANELANALYLLGALARDEKRPADQEAAWKRSAAVSESILGKNPEFDGNHGRICYNLGVFYGERHDDVIAWQTKAIDTLTPLCRAAPDRSDLAWFLSEAHVGRGVAWHDKGDDARALPDLQRAAELAAPERRREVVEFIDKDLRRPKR